MQKDNHKKETDGLLRIRSTAAYLINLIESNGGRHSIPLLSKQEQKRSLEALAGIASVVDRRETMFRHVETLQAIKANEHLGTEGCTAAQLANALGRSPGSIWELWDAGIITGSDMDADGSRPEYNEISVCDNHALNWLEALEWEEEAGLS